MYYSGWFLLLLFGVGFHQFYAYILSMSEFDMSDPMTVFYDPKTRQPFRITTIENSLMSSFGTAEGDEAEFGSETGMNDQSSTKTGGILRRIAFKSNGCTCQELTCGCCLGINLNQFNFNREGCMNFTYDPYDFAINMNMLMDSNSVFSNSFSAKYPPPLCMPLPIPYLPVNVEMCARLYDIYTPGQNLHMCFDFETRMFSATVLILHFDCMRMGRDGVALVKPGDAGGLPPSAPGGGGIPTTSPQIDSDVYDEVTEIKYKQKNH